MNSESINAQLFTGVLQGKFPVDQFVEHGIGIFDTPILIIQVIKHVPTHQWLAVASCSLLKDHPHFHSELVVEVVSLVQTFHHKRSFRQSNPLNLALPESA